jgi:hypothetical protein
MSPNIKTNLHTWNKKKQIDCDTKCYFCCDEWQLTTFTCIIIYWLRHTPIFHLRTHLIFSSFAWLFNYDYLVCFGKNISTIMLWSSNNNALEVGLILGSLIQDKAPTCIKVSLKKILSCGETKGQHMSSTLRQSVANSFSPKGQEQ